MSGNYDLATLKIEVNTEQIVAATTALTNFTTAAQSTQKVTEQVNTKQKEAKKTATEHADALTKANFAIEHQAKIYNNLLALMKNDADLTRSSTAQRW